MDKKQLDDKIKAEMDRLLREHKQRFVASRQAATATA
jgi:hypothetical protein